MIARRDGYEVDDDPERIDVDSAWGYLRGAYWSENVPREVVARAIAGSLSFGLCAPDGAQGGFARAVTDRATYADPTATPVGIAWALVNGQLAVDHGEVVALHAGALLRRRTRGSAQGPA